MPGAVGGIVGKVAGGLLAKGASKLFGGGRKSAQGAQQQLQQRDPFGFRSTGLSADFNKSAGRFDIRRDASVDNILQGITGAGSRASAGFGKMLGQVGTGFEKLGEARVAALEQGRRRAVGGLREELRRRRVAGSTFENRAVGDLELQFSAERDRIEAESFLQSIAAASELVTQQFQVEFNTVAQVLEQYNFESNLASSMINSANSLQASIAESQTALAGMEANFAQDEAAGYGNIIGGAIDDIAGMIGGAFGRGTRQVYEPPTNKVPPGTVRAT